MSTQIQPFADQAGSFGIGGLTIENGAGVVTVYGTLDLTRDKAGLAAARALQAFAAAAVAALDAVADLPDHVAPAKKPGRAANPFA